VPISASFRQGNTVTCVDVEAVANRLQHSVRFGQSLGNEFSTSRTRGTRVNRWVIEAVFNFNYPLPDPV